jgi:hypothetical protein
MQVIMIARLHAMYQRSRKVLVFLVVTVLVVNISGTVIVAIILSNISVGKLEFMNGGLNYIRLADQH